MNASGLSKCRGSGFPGISGNSGYPGETGFLRQDITQHPFATIICKKKSPPNHTFSTFSARIWKILLIFAALMPIVRKRKAGGKRHNIT